MSPVLAKPDPIVLDGKGTIENPLGGQVITIFPPDPLVEGDLYTVEVEIPDYAKNQEEAIARGDVKGGTPPPTVKTHTNVSLQCNGCRFDFKATFSEVQRILQCPNGCGTEVFIPEQYRGMP